MVQPLVTNKKFSDMESEIVPVLFFIVIMSAMYFIGRLAINVIDLITKQKNNRFF